MRVLLKWGSLAAIVVQNTSLILVACHSRTLQPRYLGSVAVFLTELLKAAAMLLGAGVSLGRALPAELRRHLRLDRLILPFSLPALCYCVHNNLWYVAITLLDPVTIAIGTQAKIAFAALFSVTLLKRRLGMRRYAALAVLVTGLAIVEAQRAQSQTRLSPSIHAAYAASAASAASAAASAEASHLDEDADASGRARGLLALLTLSLLSGLAGTLTEMLLKNSTPSYAEQEPRADTPHALEDTKGETGELAASKGPLEPPPPPSLYIRNLQMSLFSIPMGLIAVLSADSEAAYVAPFVGFNRYAFAVVVLGASGGLLTSVALRYADNLLKSFAVGYSIVLSFLYTVWGESTPSAASLFGVIAVAAASCCYYRESARAGVLGDGSAAEQGYKQIQQELSSIDLLELAQSESSSDKRPGVGGSNALISSAIAGTRY